MKFKERIKLAWIHIGKSLYIPALTPPRQPEVALETRLKKYSAIFKDVPVDYRFIKYGCIPEEEIKKILANKLVNAIFENMSFDRYVEDHEGPRPVICYTAEILIGKHKKEQCERLSARRD